MFRLFPNLKLIDQRQSFETKTKSKGKGDYLMFISYIVSNS